MKTMLASVAVLLCAAVVGRADKPPKPPKPNPSERVYDTPYDKVWTACVRAASDWGRYGYSISHSDKESGVLSFSSQPDVVPAHTVFGARVDAVTYPGHTLSVIVVRVSDSQTKVTLGGGATAHAAKVYFTDLEKQMKDNK
jgi:hypothetical protein